MERAILHSDLNCFYASVEMMLDPSLRGKAVAVCGSTEDRHGIVLAKSEKAKKAGIKTGMVNWEARQLCKDLIVVPPQYDQYLKCTDISVIYIDTLNNCIADEFMLPHTEKGQQESYFMATQRVIDDFDYLRTEYDEEDFE